MKISGNHELKSRLARTLGLDPKDVSGMVIHITPDEIVRVDVTRYVHDNELGQLIMELKEYELHEKKKENG